MHHSLSYTKSTDRTKTGTHNFYIYKYYYNSRGWLDGKNNTSIELHYY